MVGGNAMWAAVRLAIAAIAAHRPESDEDFDRADPRAIGAACKVADWLETQADRDAPDCVFSMPDGGVMFEWRMGESSWRLDIPPDGTTQWVVPVVSGDAVRFLFFPCNVPGKYRKRGDE